MRTCWTEAGCCAGFPDTPKLGDGKLSPAQFGLPDAPEFKDEQIAPLRFRQGVGQLRSPKKLLRLLAIDLHGLKEGCPSPMQLQEDLIGDLGGKRLVGIRLFEQMKRRRVIEVVLLENE